MQYIYELTINAVKRLAAFIISIITAGLAAMTISMPVMYLAVWLSTFFHDQKPSLAEAWYLWPVIALTVIVSIILSNQIERYLLIKFDVNEGDKDE